MEWYFQNVLLSPSFYRALLGRRARSQHGARRQLLPHRPDFSAAIPGGPVAQIALPAWQWGNFFSRLLLCKSHSPVTFCRSASLYTVQQQIFNQASMYERQQIYFNVKSTNYKGVACGREAPTPLLSQSPRGSRGRRHRGPTKNFVTEKYFTYTKYYYINEFRFFLKLTES